MKNTENKNTKASYTAPGRLVKKAVLPIQVMKYSSADARDTLRKITLPASVLRGAMRLVCALFLLSAGCSKRPDPLIEVTIVSVLDPVAKGEGFGKVYYRGGTLFEIEGTGERVFHISQRYGVAGDTFKLRESKLN